MKNTGMFNRFIIALQGNICVKIEIRDLFQFRNYKFINLFVLFPT